MIFKIVELLTQGPVDMRPESQGGTIPDDAMTGIAAAITFMLFVLVIIYTKKRNR